MKARRVRLLVLLLIGTGLNGAVAQKSVTTTGGKASGSGGSMTYTVGQVSYTTLTDISGSVISGVQLPFEISIVLGFNTKEINLAVRAYPNPTSHFLTLQLDSQVKNGLQYLLFDENGAILQMNSITEKETVIDMLNLPPSEYYLKVINDNDDLKTFKIIKK